jgi:hypothetical protein
MKVEIWRDRVELGLWMERGGHGDVRPAETMRCFSVDN